MSQWIIHNKEVWVLAEKVRSDGTRITHEPGKDLPNFCTMKIQDGFGLLIFGTPEWAEKYVRDVGIQHLEPVKMDSSSTWIYVLKEQFPKLTHLILDPIGGHLNVKTALIDEVLRQQ
jgi:hypothetical protein